MADRKHPHRPVVSWRLDEGTKAALDATAAEQGTTVAALVEKYITHGLVQDGKDVQHVDERLRAARGVVVDVKNRVAKALGKVIKDLQDEL